MKIPSLCHTRSPRIVVLLTVGMLLAAAHAGTIKTIASTVPSNGDVNPYGIAVVPVTMGSLTLGNILISNFNSSNNLQSTGTTVVQITPNGTVSLFAQMLEVSGRSHRLRGEESQ